MGKKRYPALYGSELEGNQEESYLHSVRCISLTQPFASLVALGAKTIETRSWRTWYRGTLLIHAARSFPRRARELCKQEPFASVLIEAGFTNPGSGKAEPGQLPLGVIVAVCILKHCVRIGTPGVGLPPAEPERSFGDYAPGRYAWILRDIQPLREPISAIGSMGLWEPESAILELLPKLSVASANQPGPSGT